MSTNIFGIYNHIDMISLHLSVGFFTVLISQWFKSLLFFLLSQLSQPTEGNFIKNQKFGVPFKSVFHSNCDDAMMQFRNLK